jgi:hypothetical protein
VGKIVASALKYPYLDCDTLIEKMAGCTVAEIFADEGEESFRDLESQVLHVRPMCILLTTVTIATFCNVSAGQMAYNLPACARYQILLLYSTLPCLIGCLVKRALCPVYFPKF